MRTSEKWTSTWLIATSLAVLIIWCLLSGGYELSDREGVQDSKGNKLGFNVPLTAELCWMLALKALEQDVTAWMEPYSMTCVCAHLLGLALIWLPAVSSRAKRAYFSLQVMFFPMGLFGLLIWVSLPFSSFDGEALSDGHPVVMSSAVWLLVSWILVFIHRKNRNTSLFTTTPEPVLPS